MKKILISIITIILAVCGIAYDNMFCSLASLALAIYMIKTGSDE